MDLTLSEIVLSLLMAIAVACVFSLPKSFAAGYAEYVRTHHRPSTYALVGLGIWVTTVIILPSAFGPPHPSTLLSFAVIVFLSLTAAVALDVFHFWDREYRRQTDNSIKPR